MKIGFFTNNYLPRKTGVAHSVANFKKGLENRGHQVYVFAPGYKKTLDKKEKAVYRYPSLKIGANFSSLEDVFFRSIPFPFSSRLRRQLKELDLDLIHSHHPFLLGGEARRLAEKEELPLVFSLHTPYQQYLSKLPTEIKEPLKEVVLKRIIAYINKSDLLLTPTKKTAVPLLKKNSQISFRVVPDGVEIEKFSSPDESRSRKEIYRKYDLSKETRLLLSVSRLTYEKNISFLLESFSYLKERSPQARLLIVGSGQGEKRLKQLAKSLNVSDEVIFTGEESYDSLPRFYQAADLFTFSSLVETQGLVLIEAMAAGLPIVALNSSFGARELIETSQTGFLTSKNPQDFAQKCLKVLSNQDLKGRFQKEAKKEARNYSVEVCTKKLLQAYQKVI